MKTYIRINNNGDTSPSLALHLSWKLLEKYATDYSSPLTAAYFLEKLPPHGQIYENISNSIQIAGLSNLPMSNDIHDSSVSRRLDYHTGSKYTLTEDCDITEEKTGSPLCILNDTDEVRAVILFFDSNVIYFDRIPPRQTHSLPTIDELTSEWCISYVNSNREIPTYFNADIPDLQPLWTGSCFPAATTGYMTLSYNEDLSSGRIFFDTPDYSPFAIV